MFFIQKTSRLAGGFSFFRIDLKLSVKVGTIFLPLKLRKEMKNEEMNVKK